MKPETTTTEIPVKDLEYFDKVRERKRLTGMWALWERLARMVKRLKLEEEI